MIPTTYRFFGLPRLFELYIHLFQFVGFINISRQRRLDAIDSRIRGVLSGWGNCHILNNIAAD